jgi:hypothetical protein
MKPSIWMLFPLAILAGAGCGHPATVQECEVIVERITELEVQRRTPTTDPKLVEQEVAESKKSLRDATMKECVGRRITDRAMRCVREAKTSKQIIDDCFD